MKKRNIISALVLTLAIGIGATSYAAVPGSTASGTVGQRLGLGRITSMRGYEYITNILKSKLGLTDADISNAISAGKTPYDLATEKGMTQEQLKSYILEEKSKAIDEAAAKGTITKEQAAAMKENLNTNMQNCTGSFGQGQGSAQGKGRGQGCGMKSNGQGMIGNGQGRGCLFPAGN